MTAAEVTVLAAGAPAAGDTLADVSSLIDAETERLGHRPLSDQAWSDVTHGAAHGAAVVAVRAADGALDAAAVATPDADARWTVETATGPGPARDHRARQLLATSIRTAVDHGGRHLVWLVQDARDEDSAIAAEFGLSAGRGLHQMERPLPTGLAASIETRPFEPDRDLDAWVRVNARAFEWNPEQGSWTAANVRARMDEPWFDAAGFLIHDRVDADGAVRMAGFCWTKVHEAVGDGPRLGEIYVIAVDPDFHGLGLGRALTLAGLEHLAGLGITHGMLFVDADNTPAVTLYEKLGFSIARTDRQYAGALRADTTRHQETT